MSSNLPLKWVQVLPKECRDTGIQNHLDVSPDEVFVIGIYHEYKKPQLADEFFHDFVDGIELNGKTVSVDTFCVICDAPAKAFALDSKYHNKGSGVVQSAYRKAKCLVEDWLPLKLSLLRGAMRSF